jgi:peptidoglycan hydrolase CwlO-like protein
MENSVSYYRMQSMNQSLIALLAHNIITYEQAVEASAEPEDLSLKLRKMFPSIEERFREGEMAPSPADFSEITGLLETKKLYEEAEEIHQSKMAERDQIIADLEREVAELRMQVDQSTGGSEELQRELEQARSETARIREESQAKINSLNERIRDLNQQLSGNGKGFFKR